MAITDVLNDDVLESISNQIGSRIKQLATIPEDGEGLIDLKRAVKRHAIDQTSPHLCETLALWMMDTLRLQQLPSQNDIRFLANFTGRWHHQILLPSGGLAYARSMAIENPGKDEMGWSVRELYEGGLARKLDAVFDLVDRQFSDAFVVRLLSIRAYQINALWILNEESGAQSVVVVTTARLPNSLETGIVYSSSEFLRILRIMPIVHGFADDFEVPDCESALSGFYATYKWIIDLEIRIRWPNQDKP